MMNIEIGMSLRAMLGDECECGDIAVIKEYDNQCFISLVDVLGHGSDARKIALLAKSYLENNYERDLVELMEGLHVYLKGTRGAVAAICRLDILSGELTYVGIGNITIRIFGAKPTRLIMKDGIVGYRMRTPQKLSIKLHDEDIIIMYSDGIKEHIDSFECASLLKENAEDIATGMLEQFGKENDDASCVVLKYSL